MKKYITLFILIIPILLKAQGIVNSGAVIVISSGTFIYINNGGYLNKSNATNTTHGTINNDGYITLTGNWTNNATDINNKVFTNLNSLGYVRFTGNTSPQLINGTNPTNFENIYMLKTNPSDIVQLDNNETNGYTTVGNGTGGRLLLYNGGLSLNSHRIIVNNPATNSITNYWNSASRYGYIISETYDASSGTGSATPQNPCNSKVQWNIGTSTGSYIFPFAPAASVTPTSVFFIYTNTGGAGIGAGNVTVSTYHTNNSNYPYPTDGTYPVLHMYGYYTIDNSANALDRFHIANVSGYTTKPTASITIYYDPVNDLNGIPEANLQAQRWVGIDATHGYWSNMPVGTVNTTSHYISGIITNNSTPCNIWVGSNNVTPLPIELIGFDGKCNGNEVLLYWSTASETNNDYFTVEKSSDMDTWTTVATVKGAGNSNTIINYTAYDYSPSFGNAEYYRLKQTDFNGKYTYSETISVKCEDIINTFTLNNLYQQGNNLILNSNNPDAIPYNIDIFDITGRKVISTKYTPINIGYNQMKVDITGLTIGCYMVVLHNATTTISQKVIINNY